MIGTKAQSLQHFSICISLYRKKGVLHFENGDDGVWYKNNFIYYNKYEVGNMSLV